MNVYDLDGTLCEKGPLRDKPFFKQTRAEREQYDGVYRKHCKNAKLVRVPIEPFVIVSGRPIRVLVETMEWCRENGLHPQQVILMPLSRTRDNMILHKTRSYFDVGGSIFYEDDIVIANALVRNGVTVAIVNGAK